jgi:uncharacterized protein
MNLCPFVKRELVKNRIRFAITEAATEEQLLTALRTELELLENDAAIETTLLIHANVLQEFADYNQFLDDADALLVEMHLDGVYQVASFHPDYTFSGTDPADAENYPDVRQIPTQNIALMNTLGGIRLTELMKACFSPVRQ